MKRHFVGIIAIFLAVLSVAGLAYVLEPSRLKGYPKAKYLSDEEAAVRPAYEQLSKKEKAVYTALLDGVNGHKKMIPLPHEISGDTYSKIYCLLEKQEADLFYLDSMYYTAEKLREAKICYRTGKGTAEDMSRELEVALDDAVFDAGLAYSEYDMVTRIHDYIIRKCEYRLDDTDGYVSTAYGCLVREQANCEGYAKAFNLIASEMGIECILVTGTTDEGENHAWNQVKVDDKWYNLDVTWDDSDVDGDVRRTYLLCDDGFFGATHFADGMYLETFECNDENNNYYMKNALYAENEEQAGEILRREIANGKTQAEIRFADSELYDAFLQRYIKDQEIFGILYANGWGDDEMLSVSVEENEKECCITVFWR